MPEHPVVAVLNRLPQELVEHGAEYVCWLYRIHKGLPQRVIKTQQTKTHFEYALQACLPKPDIAAHGFSTQLNPNIFLPATGSRAFKISPDKDSVMKRSLPSGPPKHKLAR